MSDSSTTADPVALTRLAFAATNRRDIDAVASFFAADAIFRGRMAGELYEGRQEIHRFLDDWFGSFAEIRFEAEEFVVLDRGVVLVVVIQEGRPLNVDGQVHQRDAWAIRWSADSLIVRLSVHTDIDEARAAAERLAE